MATLVDIEGLDIRYELPRDERVKAEQLNSGLTVPSPVRVLAHLDTWPDLDLLFAAEEGKLVVTRVGLLRSGPDMVLGQTLLRELPLTAIVKEVRRRLVAAFSVIDQLGDGVGVAELIARSGESVRTGTALSSHGRTRAVSQRRTLDEALLAQVATIAAAHPTRPTRAVQEQLGTSHRNATRWITAARDRGLLSGLTIPSGT